MKFGKVLLVVAAIFCFRELARVPWHGSTVDLFDCPGMDPDPWTIAIWGGLLVPRTLSVKDPPAPVVVSGCLVAAFMIAESRGLVKISAAIGLPLAIAAAICFGLWERTEKLWTRKAKSSPPQG
jgi:hypothetical protein